MNSVAQRMTAFGVGADTNGALVQQGSAPPQPMPVVPPASTTSRRMPSSSGGPSASMLKLYEMSDEPERVPFLDRLVAFNEERGAPLTSVPTISKQPIDLFRLYAYVKERGGYKEVSRAKQWKEIASLCGIAQSSSAAYTLKKQYTKLILPYECKFDRGGISVEHLIADTESSSRKGKNKAVAPSPGPSDSNSQGSYPQSGTPGSDDHGSSNSFPPPHPSPTGSPYPSGHPAGHPGSGYPPHPSPTSSPYPAGPGSYPPPTSFNGVYGHHPGYGPPHHAMHPHWGGHPPPGAPPHYAGHNTMSSAGALPTGPGGDSVSAQDPFSDDMQPSGHQPPQPGGYGHSRHQQPPPSASPQLSAQAPGSQQSSSQPATNNSNHVSSGYPGAYANSTQANSYYGQQHGGPPPSSAGPAGHDRSQYAERQSSSEYASRVSHGPQSQQHPHQGPAGHYAGSSGEYPSPYGRGPPPGASSSQAPPNPQQTGSANNHPNSYTSGGSYVSPASNNYYGSGPHGQPPPPSPHERSSYGGRLGGVPPSQPPSTESPSTTPQPSPSQSNVAASQSSQSQQPPASGGGYPNTTPTSSNYYGQPGAHGPQAPSNSSQQAPQPSHDRGQYGSGGPSGEPRSSEYPSRTSTSHSGGSAQPHHQVGHYGEYPSPYNRGPPPSSAYGPGGYPGASASTGNNYYGSSSGHSQQPPHDSRSNQYPERPTNAAEYAPRPTPQAPGGYPGGPPGPPPHHQGHYPPRTFSPLQRLLAKPTQPNNYQGAPTGQMYPPGPGGQGMTPPPPAAKQQSPPPPPNKSQAFAAPSTTPTPPSPAPSSNSSRPAEENPAASANTAPTNGPSSTPGYSTYGAGPLKRHPDFMKEGPHPQAYSNNYPPNAGTTPAPTPASQYPGYGAGVPSGRHVQGPPNHSGHWNGDARPYPPGYSANGPQPTYSSFNNKTPSREAWEQNQARSGAPTEQAPTPPWVNRGYQQGHPGSGPPNANAHGFQGSGPSSSSEMYPGSYPGNQGPKQMSHGPYAPRGPQVDPSAPRHGMYGPPPMTHGSLPPNKALPPPLPPHLQGPNERPPGSQPGPAPPGTHSGPMPHHPGFMMHPALQPPVKKELNFPPNIVEGTLPRLVKKRRLTSKDVSQIEAWRLLMCLKSGMLAESTWALDVLSVLLYDDNTIVYFGLQNLPGLLDVLLEHYVKYLGEIFDGLFDDEEEMTDISEREKNSLAKFRVRRKAQIVKKWYEIDKDVIEDQLHDSNNKCDINVSKTSENVDETSKNIPNNMSDEKLVLLNGPNNYTLRSRDGKPVKIDKKEQTPESDMQWEMLNEGYTSDSGFHDEEDDTSHIQTQFDKEKFVRFTRVLKDSSQENVKQNEKTSLPQNIASLPDVKKEKCVTNDEKCEESDVLTLKRKYSSFDELEDEALRKDDSPLCPIDSYRDSLTRRCLCLSTLIRNLSFVAGNDVDMSKHKGLMMVISRLLLLNHEHPKKKRYSDKKKNNEDEGIFNEIDEEKAVEETVNEDDCDMFESAERDWYWDTLHLILENSLVLLANISGQLDMSPLPEKISLPLLNGLLHWAVCSSSYARDHLPSTSLPSLSPQRLALEALVKLSIIDSNVDLILATPPWERLDKFFKQLTKTLSRTEDQTLREFALVLLGNFASADSGISRSIALTGNAIPQLIAFVEETEQSALNVANQRGINALRENPELMGTTLDMVRRAALCLRCLAKIPENRTLFMNFQQRLLALVMSQILDQGVAAVIADVIYECSLSDQMSNSNVTPFFPTINISDILEKQKQADLVKSEEEHIAESKDTVVTKSEHDGITNGIKETTLEEETPVDENQIPRENGDTFVKSECMPNKSIVTVNAHSEIKT